jgi:hypothetical protein
MEIFQEMNIRGDSARIAPLMDEVENGLPSDWQRDRPSESSTQAFMIGAKSVYCFVHNLDDRLPSATLYLAEKSPGVLAAINIHPHKKRQLTHEEYNSILQAFYDMIEPCARRMGVDVELTASQTDLSGSLSNKAAMKLRDFSKLANKDAGFLLTDDHDRWLGFIMTAHDEKSELDAPTLKRWLVEIEGWAPEIAEQLAGEYAFGGQLLNFTNSHREGN